MAKEKRTSSEGRGGSSLLGRGKGGSRGNEGGNDGELHGHFEYGDPRNCAVPSTALARTLKLGILCRSSSVRHSEEGDIITKGRDKSRVTKKYDDVHKTSIQSKEVAFQAAIYSLPSSHFHTRMSKIVTAVLVVLLAVVVRFSPGAPMSVYFFEKPSFLAGASQASFSYSEEGIVRFPGGDGTTLLEGRLHTAQEGSPIIIMAHGLGYSADCGLPAFAETLQEAGYSVLTVDYAGFGTSDGYPRHRVIPERQIRDLQAAVDMVSVYGADQLGVDPSRIILWGSSLSGGHVASVSATKTIPSIRAVISMVPHFGSAAESVIGTVAADPVPSIVGLLQVLVALVRCGFELLTLGTPWYVPLVGPPGSHALMQNSGDEEGYLAITPQNGGEYGWKNAITVDSILYLLPYRPLNRRLENIQAACLLIVAEKDSLCPATFATKAARRIPKAQLEILPGAGHFDVYVGELRNRTLAKMIDFLHKHVPV